MVSHLELMIVRQKLRGFYSSLVVCPQCSDLMQFGDDAAAAGCSPRPNGIQMFMFLECFSIARSLLCDNIGALYDLVSKMSQDIRGAVAGRWLDGCRLPLS